MASDVAEQSMCERRGLVDAPSDRQRLRAQGSSPFEVGTEFPERPTGEPGKEPDTHLAVFVGKRVQCLLEQRHEMLVIPRNVPRDSPAVAESSPAEQLRQAQRFG